MNRTPLANDSHTLRMIRTRAAPDDFVPISDQKRPEPPRFDPAPEPFLPVPEQNGPEPELFLPVPEQFDPAPPQNHPAPEPFVPISERNEAKSERVAPISEAAEPVSNDSVAVSIRTEAVSVRVEAKSERVEAISDQLAPVAEQLVAIADIRGGRPPPLRAPRNAERLRRRRTRCVEDLHPSHAPDPRGPLPRTDHMPVHGRRVAGGAAEINRRRPIFAGAGRVHPQPVDFRRSRAEFAGKCLNSGASASS
jgi:hypothetical protein